MKIIYKIFIGITLITLFSGSIFSIMLYEQISSITESRFASALGSIITLKQNKFVGTIDELTHDLEFLSLQPFLLSTSQNLSLFDSLPLFSVLLAEMLEHKRDFSELFIMDNDGKIIYSTLEESHGKIRDSEPYFMEGSESTFIQNFFYDLTLEEPSMIISTPLRSATGDTIGVLAGRVNFRKVSDVISQTVGLGETGESYLVNTFNFMVTESRFQEDLALKKSLYTDGIKECLNGTSSSKRYKNYRDIEVLGSYNWMSELEICIIAEISTEEILIPVKKLFLILLLYTTITLAFVNLLVFFYLRLISHPIRALIRGSEEIGKGNLAHRIRITSDDEFKKLSTAFNSMASKLRSLQSRIKKHERELADQVRERTQSLQEKVAELEKFGKVTIGRELKMIELKKKIKELEGTIHSVEKNQDGARLHGKN